MSITETSVRHESRGGSVAELVAGLAVIVLTIIGLAGVVPTFLVAIATIVFGLGLLFYGSSVVSELNHVLLRYSGTETAVGIANGWSTVFLAGVAGIVLGILALLHVAAANLVAIAVIGYGAALIVNGSASARIRTLLRTPPNVDAAIETLIQDSASDSAGLQTMAGLAAIVLGILALAHFDPTVLVLIALLGLGGFASLTSTFLAGTFANAFHMGSRG